MLDLATPSLGGDTTLYSILNVELQYHSGNIILFTQTPCFDAFGFKLCSQLQTLTFGGYAAHSLAIMTDAAHLLTDFGSIVISIFSLWLSSRPCTKNMTFGWHRAEVLAMLVSVLSMWAVTAVLVFSAAQRMADGDYDINSHIMLITSGCAVGVNILHGPQGHHRHGRSHGNASVRAAFIHVVGDLLQSLGVLLAATIIHLWVGIRNMQTQLPCFPRTDKAESDVEHVHNTHRFK
uniref:Solute carrier family 30 member 2 n=1 Tax=Sphaeramia orbicularis TaxID=375764 RepID=A0A673BLY1_9TELE